MFRKEHFAISVLVLALISSASAAAFAGNLRNPERFRDPVPHVSAFSTFSVPAPASNKRNVTLYFNMVLQGTPLQAGKYTIRWESHSATATVTVSQKKQVLATAQAKLVDRGKEFERNAIVTDTNPDGTNAIREIRPAGSRQAIVFYE